MVKDEDQAGSLTKEFTTFAEALAYSDDGDTLQVGAGTYNEVIDLDESVTIVGEEGAILDGSSFATEISATSTIELFDGFSGLDLRPDGKGCSGWQCRRDDHR